jgi:hypothetical protein
VMQAAKDVWTLRKMQVSTHEPTTGRRLSITDVVFETPRSKKPLGLE